VRNTTARPDADLRPFVAPRDRRAIPVSGRGHIRAASIGPADPI